MNTINPKEIIIIEGLPPVAKKGDKISLDTEFFNQIKARLHRPHGDFAFLGCSYDGKTVYYTTDEKKIPEFMHRIDAGVHIWFNAKYDYIQLRRFATMAPRRNLWDCMLIEQIMWSGYYTDFALRDLVRRYLDTYMSKEVREEFSDNPDKVMTQEMIEYSCADVAYTWRVYQEQKNLISETDLNLWRNIELKFMWAILEMDGIRLDQEKWIALAKRNYEEAQAIQAKYGHEEEIVGPRGGIKKNFIGINLNSPLQVKQQFKKLGWKVDDTNAETLERLSEDCEFAKEMMTYRTFSKRSSTYGEKFVEDYVEPDGKIYASIYQIGAETGRTSCRAPNLQNQPHLTEYRECFIADEDQCVVVADWSAQEPKFAAFLSQDENLISDLNSTEKLYIRVGRNVLEREITKDSEEYKHMKSTVLGLFYGMSAKGLSKRLGITEELAQEYIDKILDVYHGFADWMKEQYHSDDYVQTVSGRKIWLNKYSNQWQRNSLNAPIQGSAADAMKIAASRFVENSPNKLWKIALLVHDEIVVLCPREDCESVMKYLSDTMISVASELHEGIKGAVEVFSGSNWGVKH